MMPDFCIKWLIEAMHIEVEQNKWKQTIFKGVKNTNK